jgi:hypothetical protein
MEKAMTIWIKKVPMMKNGQFKQTFPGIRPSCPEARWPICRSVESIRRDVYTRLADRLCHTSHVIRFFILCMNIMGFYLYNRSFVPPNTVSLFICIFELLHQTLFQIVLIFPTSYLGLMCLFPWCSCHIPMKLDMTWHSVGTINILLIRSLTGEDKTSSR